jgi:hypothetical protein
MPLSTTKLLQGGKTMVVRTGRHSISWVKMNIVVIIQNCIVSYCHAEIPCKVANNPMSVPADAVACGAWRDWSKTHLRDQERRSRKGDMLHALL